MQTREANDIKRQLLIGAMNVQQVHYHPYCHDSLSSYIQDNIL
ncbi:hypothetical protein [Paraglaciecola psychrophila]|uniref:Uncharacterized protein n=1 Tax=Paraglaciecola psychrophila 170 TaxID=1129794 RepID=K6ZR16_9ALTE|nr:hypothetical protein [Paraglaciecola psychrophila]AGH46400.1 hypothetical protein C427_4298 [Paraglaciecola psychrophila 170]GAC38366.1 hypothetical protein GPSY_2754 [Paraglaciecola psychrophila 170]